MQQHLMTSSIKLVVFALITLWEQEVYQLNEKRGKNPKKQTSIPIVFLKYCCLISLTLRHDLPKIYLTFFIIYIY